MVEFILRTAKDFAQGKHASKFWGAIIIIIILCVIVFPYIDANFLYYNRIQKRIEILSSVSKIDILSLNNNELKEEYSYILNEIANSRENLIKPSKSNVNSNFNYWVKFCGGGALFWIIALISLFKIKKNQSFFKNNLLTFVVLSILGLAFAFVFAKIPVIFNVWIDSLLSPIIQLIIIVLLFYGTLVNKK